MEEFSIQIKQGNSQVVYQVKALGEFRYQIFIEGEHIGIVQLDQENHASGCVLDMPLLHSLRDAIHAHEANRFSKLIWSN